MTTASDDVSIGTAVDTANAFIIVSVRGQGTSNAQDLDEIYVTSEFVDSTTIRFKRQGTTNDCVVSWQVVEADSNAPTPAFTVETGEISFTTSDNNLTDTISDITSTTNAVVLCQARNTAASDDRSHLLFRGTLDNSTTVRLRRAATGSAVAVRYWVIKWSTDCTVRTGSVAMTGASASDTFSAVTSSRSLIFMTYDADTNGLAQTSVKTHLSSNTQIDFEREVATGTCNIEYAVVEFPTSVTGQAEAADWGDSTYSHSSTITAVDRSATIITASNECTGSGTAFPRPVVTCYLSDSTTVSLQTSYDGQTNTAAWTLVDTSGWTYT